MGDDLENQSEQEQPTNPETQLASNLANEFPFVKSIRIYLGQRRKIILQFLAVLAVVSVIVAAVFSYVGYKIGAWNIQGVKGQLKQVTKERDKAQLMNAPFQAMALQIYTNVPIDKRFDLFTRQVVKFQTNLLSQLVAEKPVLKLIINNQSITNNSTVLLDTNRNINIKIFNASTVTANNITIFMFFPLGIATSNIVFQGWDKMPPLARVDKKTGVILANRLANSFRNVAEKPTGESGSYLAPSLVISTNFQLPVITCYIDFYSSHSKSDKYFVSFLLPKN